MSTTYVLLNLLCRWYKY